MTSDMPPLGSHGLTWPALQRLGGKAVCGLLRRRLKKGIGTIVLLVGMPGSGKSFSALWIASEIDSSFNASRVVFDVRDYIGYLAAGTTPGQAVLLDEAGVLAPARKWQSEGNIALMLTVESVRHRGLLTLITVPDVSMVDNTVRKLAYMVIQCRRVDDKAEEVVARPYEIQLNHFTGVTYRKNPWTLIGGKIDEHGVVVRPGQPVKWSSVRLGRPPLALETEYQAKRKAAMDALYKSLSDSLTESKETVAIATAQRPTVTCGRCGYSWRHGGSGRYIKCYKCGFSMKRDVQS